jgi:serine/threonine protein kinase
LGRGSFGDVYEATRDKESYAIKMFSDPGMGKENLEFFLSENIRFGQ